MSVNTVVRKNTGNVRYKLIKERIPQGTTVVHYIVPVELNGRLTQEIPVSELESNPAKWASMFPQYIDKVTTAATVTIRPLNKEYKVEGGTVVKKQPRRTVADISAPHGKKTTKADEIGNAAKAEGESGKRKN